ncbi:MAG: excinuclease ABC subunit UvrB [Fibrobacteraceae bacterium]
MARARKTISPDPYQKPILKKLTPEQSRPGTLPQFLEPTRAEFDLQSPYNASGDQPQAIEELCQGFNRGENFQCLLGVTGSGKTFTMANVIKSVGKPTLVLSHNKTLAAQLYQEFKAFFPNNAVEYFVSYYDYYQPEAYIVHTDTFIEKDASINDEIDKLRLRATSNLLTRRDTIIVASVSCIYGLGSPREYFDLMVRLKKGEVKERDLILMELVHIQYSRNDFALERGSFRVRGDVIEVYPSYDDVGIRIELFGDTVDRISRFNLLTGEALEELADVRIAPAKHFVTREDSRDRIAQDIQQELNLRVETYEKEEKELRKMGLVAEADMRVLAKARLESRTRYDMEMIRATGVCSGIENYSRIVEERMPGTRPFTLLDYFGDDWLMMIDESHVSVPQIGGMSEGDKSRKTTLVQYGFRLPCALDNRPMNFGEFEAVYPKQVLFVSATPGDYELRKTGGAIVEQINRPTGLLDPQIEMYPVKGQMDVLLKKLGEVTARGERALVTTLTKKMAQDLTDFLVEANVRARYLHGEIKTLERHKLLKDLRKGDYDVLVGINLLREGLDLPEVSMVAILDADKEGFLRNYRSLIQTMGRASRNVNGKVLLFADVMTESLEKALAETKRRRSVQEAFNKEHGIVPQSVARKLDEDLEMSDPLGDIMNKGKKSKKGKNAVEMPSQVEDPDEFSTIEELEAKMQAAATRLDFEEAARLRDLILSRKE